MQRAASDTAGSVLDGTHGAWREDTGVLDTEDRYLSRFLRELSTLARRPRARAARELHGSIGRYHVVEVLGHGGMGTVHLGHDRLLDRPVALKLLHPDVAPRQCCLLREAQALARVSHPNVVRIYEAGVHDRQWFIVMELVRGEPLTRWQRRARAWQDVVEVYLQAGAGLAAAHAVGLVHRDFKPDNCIVGEDGCVKVLDFGLARPMSGTLRASTGEDLEPESQGSTTHTGTVAGTLGYMPLEQLRGQPVDVRSDQFSFCVALHEALYGQRPFTTETMDRMLLAMLADDVQPAPAGAQVPPALRQVLLRGLSSDPDARWPSMPALLEALEGILRAERPLRPRLRLGHDIEPSPAGRAVGWSP